MAQAGTAPASLVVSLFTGTTPLLLNAQPPESPTAVLEEVIVTATKRAENLQDVAVAVSAVPDWVLNANQIVRSEELT